MKTRAKKCKECGKLFMPKVTTTQQVCSWQCAILYTEAQKEKAWRKEKRERVDVLKSHSEHLKDLQIVFNRFIRLRDKTKGCISCGRSLGVKYDAGHFYSVGRAPELRFDEDNVHAQCVHCNRHLHGNLIEYREGLIERIGMERFEALRGKYGNAVKLSVDDIKSERKKYMAKIRELKKNN